jgi:thioredoxin reductase
MSESRLPVAVIGAGPVGLAAAAHLVARGETPVVFEAGASPAASVQQWAHVRLFSPWKYNVDTVAAAMLEAAGWTRPPANEHPTGGELAARYLLPLAALPAIGAHIRLNARVTGVSRLGMDRTKTTGRGRVPFVLRVVEGGVERDVPVRAVIDASGTYSSPNPLGANGLPALGETAARERIFHGIPDVLGRDRARYAGKRVLVVGSGHSAFGTLLDLAALRREEPETEILWAVRRPSLDHLFGGGDADQLAERGRLGSSARTLIQDGTVQVFTGFQLTHVARSVSGVVVASAERALPEVDEIVATTGFRPDIAMLRDVRLALDPVVESPSLLAPLIDPNVHSCGSVPPHGFEELQHPEQDFYVVGMKSYGRAPTFLMMTGYEQVRSVVAALAGDFDAARRVELELPETGVCSSDLINAPALASACCGSEPSGNADSCGTDSCAQPIPLLLSRPARTGSGCC